MTHWYYNNQITKEVFKMKIKQVITYCPGQSFVTADSMSTFIST